MISRTLVAGLCTAMVVGPLAGCAQMAPYYPSMYAALQSREQLKHPPPPGQRVVEPLSYQQYQAERRGLIDDRRQ